MAFPAGGVQMIKATKKDFETYDKLKEFAFSSLTPCFDVRRYKAQLSGEEETNVVIKRMSHQNPLNTSPTSVEDYIITYDKEGNYLGISVRHTELHWSTDLSQSLKDELEAKAIGILNGWNKWCPEYNKKER